jgi:predicted regulator of Ras-like GTPase activity (Roadblock/LC7/MglB family)
MSESLESLLRSLRDVDGVVGSFVLSRQGALAARDLPEYFDAGALTEVGPRVERLYDAWKSLDAELETASLVFADHRLHLRELGTGFLAVVSSVEVNAPALRMAISMVSRRVGPALEARASVPPPPLPTERTSAERTSTAPRASQPAPAPSPEPDGQKVRMYRGRVVD